MKCWWTTLKIQRKIKIAENSIDYKFLVDVTLWVAWKQRNDATFNQKDTEVKKIWNFMMYASNVQEVKNNRDKLCPSIRKLKFVRPLC